MYRLFKTPNQTKHYKARLLVTETHTFFDCKHKFVFQHLHGWVRRQINAVETSVGLGQLIDLTALFDCEAAWAIATLQVLETVHRNTRRAGRKLKQTRALLSRPLLYALPEPLHLSLIHI